MKALHTDGKEVYISNEVSQSLHSHVIACRTTVAYTLEQNGLPERMNYMVWDIVQSMMAHNTVPKDSWRDAVGATAFLRNTVTCQGPSMISTSFQVWSGAKLDLMNF